MKEESLTPVIPKVAVSQPIVKLPVVEDNPKEKFEISPICFQREKNRRGRTRGFTLRRGRRREDPTEIPPAAEDTAEKTFPKQRTYLVLRTMMNPWTHTN